MPATKTIVGYRAAHHRLVRLMGRASEHECGCGARAEQWAFDHADPDHLTSPEGRPFSLDPERYMPMCRSCHTYMDWRMAQLSMATES